MVTRLKMQSFAVALVLLTASGAGAQVHDGYATLAEALASPAFFDIEQAKKGHADTAVMLRMAIARQQLMGLRLLPLELAPIRNSSLEGLEACHASMGRLRDLNRYMPDFDGIARKTLDAAPGLLRAVNKEDLTNMDKQALGGLALKAGSEIIGGLVNAYNASSERDTYRNEYARTRANAVRAIAKVCASQYKTTRKAARQALNVGFTGSWNSTFVSDWLDLTNDTGKDLTNCSIVVSLSGYNAQSGNKEYDAHLHFVKRWPAGTRLYAPYPSRAKQGIATNESADSVESVVVTLLSDQCWDRINYVYEGENYDRDVKRYFETVLKPRFTGRWYHYDNHLFYNNGFQFSYEGSMSSFPVSHITVTAKQGGAEQALRWTINGGRMSADSNMWLSDDRFNGINNPESVVVQFEFPRSAYKHEITWNLRR